MLDKIQIEKKIGGEPFIGNSPKQLLDYWSWAHSDMISNAERGVLAEFIVGMALDALGETRTEWDAYDLETKDGIKIEVKASGYIQTWIQKSLSTPLFGIRPTIGSTDGGATFSGPRKRQADIYVFCIHAHKEQETANPLDLSQWEFYVLTSRKLDQDVPFQKTLSFNGLIKLGAIQSDFWGLKNTVDKAMRS